MGAPGNGGVGIVGLPSRGRLPQAVGAGDGPRSVRDSDLSIRFLDQLPEVVGGAVIGELDDVSGVRAGHAADAEDLAAVGVAHAHPAVAVADQGPDVVWGSARTGPGAVRATAESAAL